MCSDIEIVEKAERIAASFNRFDQLTVTTNWFKRAIEQADDLSAKMYLSFLFDNVCGKWSY